MSKHTVIDTIFEEDITEESYPKILAINLFGDYYAQNADYPMDQSQEDYFLDRQIGMSIELLREGGIQMDYKELENKVRENYALIKQEHCRQKK